MSNLHGSRSRFSVFLTALTLCGGRLSAAPLENGFALAPAATASPEEKTAAFGDARLRVLDAAGKYENTPYRYGGLDRRGLDCSGLVYLSFKDALDISVPRNAAGLYSWVEKIQIENARPGDLVFFKTDNNGNISHVGIFVGDRRFIHAASEGPKTGVIYSSLNERYWSLTYAGAGRVLPEADIAGSAGNKDATAAKVQKQKKERGKKSAEEGRILLGIAAAPTWGTFFADSSVVRGAAGQFRLGAAVKPFGQPMILGMELRPEWDGVLGVFRLPITLSWGINDKLRIFAGPAFSFGDAALTASGESRHYIGGTSWFGAAGITVAPFAIKIAGNDLAPYAELAWQSYFSNDNDKNYGADFAASYRFSTGIRYTWKKW
ncbi:MAG: C40 family peptidase [Treponema sp.]|jgi:probable lipoprotein NlpC|nr:C40 family peptidase [Treponema sp.]